MKTSEFILANRGTADQGRTRGQVLIRSLMETDAEVVPLDEQSEENAIRFLSLGYRPGQISQLNQQLTETEAQLATEQDKVRKAAGREARIQQMYQAGRIDAFGVMRMMAEADQAAAEAGEVSDEGAVGRLENRVKSLRRQLSQAQETAAPPEPGPADPLEAASRRAHEIFTEITRARMAEAESGAWRTRPEPRPFASVSRGAAGDECSGPDCPVCTWGRQRDAAPYAEVYR